MTAHGFRLGQVLEHKRRVEEQRQLELQQHLVEQERLAEALHEVQARLEEQIEDVSERARHGSVNAAELEAASRYVSRLQSQLAHQRDLFNAHTSEVTERREALMLALQERRALELLQERQEAAARVDENRREERAVDDLNTARFGLGHTG